MKSTETTNELTFCVKEPDRSVETTGAASSRYMLFQAKHQPHVLHSRAGCALAEIIEPRDQQRLMVLVSAEHVEFEHVGLVQRFGLELSAPGRVVLERQDLHVGAARVPLCECRMEIGCSRLSRKRVEMQRHRYQHALPIVAHGRHENRPAREPGIKLGLRQMLVLEAETVELE